MNHCIQYATVGDLEEIIIFGTEHLSDDQIKERVIKQMKELPYPCTIHRYDRCPECETWTTCLGKLRTELKKTCPAVKRELAKKRS